MATTKQAENGNEMVDDCRNYEQTDPSFIDDLRKSKEAVAVAAQSAMALQSTANKKKGTL